MNDIYNNLNKLKKLKLESISVTVIWTESAPTAVAVITADYRWVFEKVVQGLCLGDAQQSARDGDCGRQYTVGRRQSFAAGNRTTREEGQVAAGTARGGGWRASQQSGKGQRCRLLRRSAGDGKGSDGGGSVRKRKTRGGAWLGSRVVETDEKTT